ncbi:hypothetical protein AGROH133_14264 (plasmid) [Agrobacterium tumefaciens]|nr:hypothetical protein AGROH133_14264 [Agrobacterium tumefaciens]
MLIREAFDVVFHPLRAARPDHVGKEFHVSLLWFVRWSLISQIPGDAIS